VSANRSAEEHRRACAGGSPTRRSPARVRRSSSTVRDRHGVLLKKRRIPAVMVGERGTWSFRCRWRAGAYTVRARAYDVAGNRQAAASRATLTVY